MADPKFDPESFLKASLVTLKANLNAKLTAIDAEKGDFTLAQINADAWHLNTIPKNFAREVFVIYGILEESGTDIIEVGSIRKITLQFEVGLNAKDEATAAYRILRYRRALEETVSDNFRKFGGGKKVKVDALTPATVVRNKTRFEFSGINISIHLDN